jgi:hypothetical protein
MDVEERARIERDERAAAREHLHDERRRKKRLAELEPLIAAKEEELRRAADPALLPISDPSILEVPRGHPGWPAGRD